jgi:hypothetical protein
MKKDVTEAEAIKESNIEVENHLLMRQKRGVIKPETNTIKSKSIKIQDLDPLIDIEKTEDLFQNPNQENINDLSREKNKTETDTHNQEVIAASNRKIKSQKDKAMKGIKTKKISNKSTVDNNQDLIQAEKDNKVNHHS